MNKIRKKKEREKRSGEIRRKEGRKERGNEIRALVFFLSYIPISMYIFIAIARKCYGE